MTMQQFDSRYFSQRAKHISLLNEQSSSVFVKSPLLQNHFQFSNRICMPISDTSSGPVGRGHGNHVCTHYRQSIGLGRSRTTVPLSSFVLQKDDLSSTSTAPTTSSPMFVTHDEVQFVRRYFRPLSNNQKESSFTSDKREILLSALKEIDSDLKTL